MRRKTVETDFIFMLSNRP